MSVLRQPIPDKLVILTFDDGSISQLRNAGPLLKELDFGGTFFITEGLKIPQDKMLPADQRTFMTWPEVKELEQLGGGRFEIANHTRSHRGVAGLSHEELVAELQVIDQRCEQYGLPRTCSFCYPGYGNTPEAVETLRLYGMGFARRGSTGAGRSTLAKRQCNVVARLRNALLAPCWLTEYTILSSVIERKSMLTA